VDTRAKSEPSGKTAAEAQLNTKDRSVASLERSRTRMERWSSTGRSWHSPVVLVPRPKRSGKLVIERLAIADAAPQELRPLGHVGDGVGGLGQETPELGVVPAEFVAGAVTMPADPTP
jgi:hypothetical protein